MEAPNLEHARDSTKIAGAEIIKPSFDAFASVRARYGSHERAPYSPGLAR
jgi:hypothetical protein